MHEIPTETARSIVAAQAEVAPQDAPLRRRILRLGIGGRLGLGLAALAAVILAGHILASRTTRLAVDAVRSMQTEHEPRAQRASAVVESLIAYDRAVIEYLQEGRTSGFGTITDAADALDAAVLAYFQHPADGQPSQPATPPGTQFLPQLTSHIGHGRDLAKHAAQRADWLEQRHAALDRVQRRIASAGGGGLAISGTQVVATRSLSELAAAINAVRGNFGTPAVIAQGEREFESVLARHTDELQRSPGRNWLDLERQDFSLARKLRLSIEKFDTTNGTARREFLEESAALTARVQQQLQEPARRGLVNAAARAATSAEVAQRTLTMTGIAVLGFGLLVSVLLAVSISLPVRRLTAATKLLATGNRGVRAPRGGSAEIDALAESFNTMADQIARAEAELRAHQAELERHVAERTRQLHHLAHHDPLTQLPNRRQLAAHLGGALARATTTGQRVALLFVDVDNFKSINDTLGHNFGDRVLQGIAERLRAAGYGRAMLARLGGDEFTMLIEDVKSVEEVEERAAQIVTTLQQPLTVDGRLLATSASVGASLFPDHADDSEQLLRAADVALFRAKELGRNRYALYKPALYDAAAQRFRLEQSLRRAVEAGDLMLMFQPQIALHTFEVTGLEALLRWRKSDGRIATATEFIHIAEKTGLIHELTDWVLRSATSTVAAWRAQGWQCASVAINVSPPQFFESDFVEHIARALQVTGLPASALELELTETVLQTGPTTIDSLRRLRELGVSIALDDFGIGYSSLTSLEQLPITRVKLDRMLVAGVDSNPRSAAIVRSIVALCHGLGLQVVAEGVERPAQLEFLSHCGPIGVQGYLLAYPVETHDAQKESQAAAARARSILEITSKAPVTETGTGSLVFVGANGWRRTS
ncbi:MAG: putative bifunctional diguanylate cyclase/phosphodiesterase [Steroidobacteraceae bacterium]